MEEGSPLTVAGAAADSASTFEKVSAHRVPVLRPVCLTGTDDRTDYSGQSPRGNHAAITWALRI
ncbi:hypothetical protein GCM10017643_27820 [Ancylobacter dichloromethanicus]|uniref:Uncharacterized protein n=1 Tax=Ancylobacter dichloromethanicus TaxID=518825 RepID=A0A9W6JA60_9HYPH|nr:hypothetical protein GCM10017643_27820 [Ancylobacter dichloromethanicus]